MDVAPSPPGPSDTLDPMGLADLLGLALEDLQALAAEADTLYRRFPVPRPGRRPRWIDAPEDRLAALQRRLLQRVLYRIPAPDPAHGFVPGRSILSHASRHAGCAWVLGFDLRDFFPSVTRDRLDLTLAPHLADPQVRDLVLALATRHGLLPQGAPTSPHLANLAFAPADARLADLAAHHGLAYSRYADDLTFSGDTCPEDFAREVASLVEAEGFRLAPEKTRALGRHRRQQVTGLVVNEGARLPRELRRRIRAMVHQARDSTGALRPELLDDRARGYLALASMCESAEACPGGASLP